MGYVRNSQYESNKSLPGTTSDKKISYSLTSRIMATMAIIHRFKDYLSTLNIS